MKKFKWIFILLIIMMLVGSLGLRSTSAQENVQIYMPLIYNMRPKTPSSFGVHMADINSVSLQRAAEANNYWVRYNGLQWSKVQPVGPTQWLWENYANLEDDLAAANRFGMEVILIVRSTPLWAQKRNDGNYCGPMAEANIDHFAVFMGELVKRYSQPPYNVKYYEIWNEPDSPPELVQGLPNPVYGCWGDPDDPTGGFGGGYYGQVLKAVYPQVKAASGGTAQVVLGGLLLPADPDQVFIWSWWKHPGTDWLYADQSKFFEGILRECQGQHCFDYVNFHGFTFYRDFSLTGIQQEENEDFWLDRGGQVEGKLDFLRSLMAKYGISHKPILLTETGLPLPDVDRWDTWNAAQKATYEAAKADYLVYLYTRNMARGISGSTWYHMDKYGWHRSGLLDSNNNPLPAYEAYQFLTGSLYGAIYQGDPPLTAGMRGFEFKKSDRRLWVLFSEDVHDKTINQPAKFIRAYDLFGAPVTPVNNQIKFSRPIYIELLP